MRACATWVQLRTGGVSAEFDSRPSWRRGCSLSEKTMHVGRRRDIADSIYRYFKPFPSVPN